MAALFSRYKEAAYLHSGMGTTAERGEKQSSAARVALSQTSWVANGEGAAPAVPVEIQREAGFHLPLPTLAITLSHLVPWTITALMDW